MHEMMQMPGASVESEPHAVSHDPNDSFNGAGRVRAHNAPV